LQNLTISDGLIDSEADALAFYTNWAELPGVGDLCAYVTVTNCVLSAKCCGIRIGSKAPHVVGVQYDTAWRGAARQALDCRRLDAAFSPFGVVSGSMLAPMGQRPGKRTVMGLSPVGASYLLYLRAGVAWSAPWGLNTTAHPYCTGPNK
jgi:hypothetical protein